MNGRDKTWHETNVIESLVPSHGGAFNQAWIYEKSFLYDKRSDFRLQKNASYLGSTTSRCCGNEPALCPTLLGKDGESGERKPVPYDVKRKRSRFF